MAPLFWWSKPTLIAHLIARVSVLALVATAAVSPLALADSHLPIHKMNKFFEETDLFLEKIDNFFSTLLYDLGLAWLLVGFSLVSLFLGMIIGRRKERKHYESIRRREKALLHIPTTTAFLSDDKVHAAETCTLAFGATVVSGDKFKDLLSYFRNLVGGRMNSYASLADRARREAILRMKESCPDADEFINCRIQSSSISAGVDGKGFVGVEVIAYATAVRYKK